MKKKEKEKIDLSKGETTKKDEKEKKEPLKKVSYFKLVSFKFKFKKIVGLIFSEKSKIVFVSTDLRRKRTGC